MLIPAIDLKGGKLVQLVQGERLAVETTDLDEWIRRFCGEFLYTHVDKEGLMKGTDLAAITAVRRATRRPLIAAGGVTTQEEIDELDRLGIDAVVGMAIYTGALDLDRARPGTTPK